MPPQETLSDANLADASSASAGASTSTEPNQQGAKDSTSPVETNAKPAESKKTLREVAHEFMADYKLGDKSDKTPAELEAEALAEKSGPQKGQDLSEQAPAKVDEKSVEAKTQTLPSTDKPVITDDAKLPFHNHPRFKQLIEERNSFERQLKDTAPLIDAGKRMQTVEKFCQTNGVKAEDYDAAIRIAALVNNNPEKAVEALDKLSSELKVRVGQALPADLQTRVDDGKISLTDAQEISKLRVQAMRSTHEVKQTKEQTAVQVRQQLESSLNAWTINRMSTDPSYKPSTDGSYGKFEQIQDRFTQLAQRENPGSIDAFVKLAEKAYSDVHQFLERSIPKPVQRRPVSTTKSVKEEEKAVDIRKPGWAREVARRTLANA